MFSRDNITKYLFAISVLLIASILGKKIKQSFIDDDPARDYKMIQQYLLNDDKLYHFNKPNLWIHSKYEINARKWQSFGSRNTYDLNQPYLHLTIKSIIYYCGRDFNICLIDDDSFDKLLHNWNIPVASYAEPFRTQFRELGMLRLLHDYGGIVVPNSFLCLRNLQSIYKNAVEARGTPFIMENRTTAAATSIPLEFAPDIHFMGAKKNCPVIADMIAFVEARNSQPHYTTEHEFLGDVAKYAIGLVRDRQMQLLSAENVGCMTAAKKPVLLDNLMEEEYLQFSDKLAGIYIPAEEILRRPKYEWFAVLPIEEIVKGQYILAKYMAVVARELAENVESAGARRGGGAQNVMTL